MAVLCLVLVAGLSADNPAEPYAWPLDLPRALSSSFAEYRPGRFHAGIDLRTNGVGRPVYAAGDGYVERVRCSPWGYGKAVYLRLNDGTISVYAHLDRFEEPLAEYVRREQHRLKNYTVDLHPGTTGFPVTRGQRIAFSGETGVGVPHLHWELRDSANRPFSPRSVGITWPDRTRPRLQKLVVIPRDPDARVNGDLESLILTPRHLGDGRYSVDPVRVRGAVGFGVDCIDPANEGANKLGVHILRADTPDGTLFEARHDRLSYDTLYDGVTAYHPYLKSKGRFLLLYRWPGNRSQVYRHSSSDGWFTPAAETDVTIVAEDFMGNRATLTVPIRLDTAAPPAGPPAGLTGKGTVSIAPMDDWLLITAAFDAPEPETPLLMPQGASAASGGTFFRVDGRTFRAGFKPDGVAQEVTLHVEHPRIASFARDYYIFRRGEAARTVTLGEAQVTVQPGSPYGTLFLRGDPASGPASPFPLRGGVIGIWPEAAPIDESIRISLPQPAGLSQPSRARAYRARTSYWGMVDTELANGRLTFRTGDLGRFSVMEDDKPPVVSGLRIGSDNGIVNRRPAITASVSDTGSGVAGVTVTCGGQWLLTAYDPERNRIAWEQDEDLPPGEQELVITATDSVGNSTVQRRNITIPSN